MSKPIIKSFLFLTATFFLFLLWKELVDSWRNNIHVPNVDLLPITYEYNTVHQGDSAGFVTNIQLSDFDVEKSEITLLISVNYDRTLDQDARFPRLRSVALNFYQPSGDSWFKTDVTIPIDNTYDLMSSKVSKLSVLNNYAVKVPLYPLGWYPYEVYNAEIEPEFVISYSGGSRGRGATSRNINISAALANHISQYEIAICDPVNPDPIFKDCDKLSPDIHKIVIQQRSQRKVLFDIIIILFMIFTLLAFWIGELSNLLEVAVGLLLGIWGLRAVIIPDKISYDVSWGGESIIMNFYVSLGAIIIFWIISSAFTSFLMGLEHLPSNVFEYLLTRFPALMNYLYDIDEYWDTNTVAQYLHIHPDAVREQARNHLLPGEKVNHRWRFAVQEIIRVRNRGR